MIFTKIKNDIAFYTKKYYLDFLSFASRKKERKKEQFR